MKKPTDDTISFDINNPDELHIQDIKKVDYSDVDSTTTLTINDASVMTTSVNNIKIIYDEDLGNLGLGWQCRAD